MSTIRMNVRFMDWNSVFFRPGLTSESRVTAAEYDSLAITVQFECNVDENAESPPPPLNA